MAEYLNKCIKCNSYSLAIIEEINPQTTDLNMDVIFQCNKCGHEFKGRETSHHTEWERSMGMTL